MPGRQPIRKNLTPDVAALRGLSAKGEEMRRLIEETPLGQALAAARDEAYRAFAAAETHDVEALRAAHAMHHAVDKVEQSLTAFVDKGRIAEHSLQRRAYARGRGEVSGRTGGRS